MGRFLASSLTGLALSCLALTTVALTTIALGPSAVLAQASMGEAEQYFRDGERLYAAGDFESSLASFQRAYDLLAGNPQRHLVLFNMGRCQEALFRYTEAIDSYSRFLAEARSGPIREARQQVALLRRDLATLQIQSNAAATVWIDDHDTGQRVPGNVFVSSGRHVVSLRAGGYAPSQQDVQVAPRTVIPLSYSMERTFSGLHPVLAISGGGLAVASLGVGVTFGAVAMDERTTLDDRLASSDLRERFQVTQASIDAMQQNALIADVLFGVAGGLAVATVVLLFLTDWGGESAPSASTPAITPFASEHELGLSLRGAL